MFVYNPEGFEPKHYLPPHLHDHSDCARMLVHVVLAEQAEKGLDELAFARLSALVLRKQVHSRLCESIRDALAASNAIDVEPAYCPGVKCMGFRIGGALRRRKVARVELHDKAVARRNPRAPGCAEPVILNEVHEMMWHWLNSLEIDYLSAARLLDGKGAGLRNLGRKSLMLEKLKAKELFFKPDGRGRVYHNLTSLWREFRPFLKIGGKRLANIDVRNSQPLLFSICLREYFSTEKQKSIPHTSSSIYFSVAQKQVASLPCDVALYVELTQRGEFYEYLMERFGVARSKRDKFKKSFFASVFYSKLHTKRRLALLFADLFPNVNEAIRHYKRHDHRDLPLLMQKTEADLMIGTVCQRLVRDFRHVPFVTIHDSILTTSDNAQMINFIMRDAFADLGLAPTFDIKAY